MARDNLSGNPYLVLCAGIPRSGSTWVYNAARLLLEADPSKITYGCWVADYEPFRSADCHVVKIHERNDELAGRARAILTSHRDLRDIAASAWLRGWVTGEPSTLQFVERAVGFHAYWIERGALDLPYVMIHDAPLEALARIDARLGAAGKADHAAVLERLESLPKFDLDTRLYDPLTLLHKQHGMMNGKSGYFNDILPAGIVAGIESRFGSWLRTYGYLA